MRITRADNETGLHVEVSTEVAAKVLRIQNYVGNQLSEATLDAIAKDLGPLQYQPREDTA